MKKEISFPAGTVFDEIPFGTKTEYGEDNFECSAVMTKDNTVNVIVGFDEDAKGIDEYVEVFDTEAVKPPLGAMPDYIWEDKRIRELAKAVYEYCDSGYLDDPAVYEYCDSGYLDDSAVNLENWTAELLSRLAQRRALKQRRGNKC